MPNTSTHAADRATPQGHDPLPADTWTRGQVAKELGLSITSVRRLERAGKLVPRFIGPNGVRHFDPSEVRALKAHSPAPPEAPSVAGTTPVPAAPPPKRQGLDGPTAAAVFTGIAHGLSPAQIVMELQVEPVVVEDAVRAYVRLERLGVETAEAGTTLARMDARLATLEAAVNDFAQPGLVPCLCCGGTGQPRIQARMSCCGSFTQFGGAVAPGDVGAST